MNYTYYLNVLTCACAFTHMHTHTYTHTHTQFLVLINIFFLTTKGYINNVLFVAHMKIGIYSIFINVTDDNHVTYSIFWA